MPPTGAVLRPDGTTVGSAPAVGQAALNQGSYSFPSVPVSAQSTGPTPPAPPPVAPPSGPTAAQIAGITQSNAGINSLADANASNSALQLLKGPNGIVDTINSLKQGQTGIDQGRIQDALARTQGLNGVLQMVNHGIQSGGITLANDNASNSSAAEALARAYGIQGRDAASQVGNQFGIAENKQDVAQTAQDQASEEGVNHLQANKAQAINSIVGTALQQLTSLSTMAGSLGVTGQVNVEAEKQAIIDRVTQQLSQYDSQIAGVTPPVMAPADIAAKANALVTGGTAASAPFNYNNIGPTQLQGTGPAASPLPIYVAPAKKPQ